MSDDLTVCTVFYDAFTGACLEMNVALADALNRTRKLPWVVVDNSAAAVVVEEPTNAVTVVQGKAPDTDIPPSVRGSYHHGTAITQSIVAVATRFALVLDVDFFIVRPDWATTLIDHATTTGLAFFGAPWHPRWFNKFRGFPCVHCLLIDLDRVSRDDLDFRPDLVDGAAAARSEAELTTPARPGTRRARALTIARNLWTMLLLRDRRAIGASRDTGFRLHRRFAGDPRFPVECLQPVYRPEEQFVGPRYALGPANRLFERFLPERMCYLPKHAQTFSRTGFREHGRYDAGASSWEEFLWRGQPFGFHIRGYQNRTDDDSDLRRLREALATFGLPTR